MYLWGKIRLFCLPAPCLLDGDVWCSSKCFPVSVLANRSVSEPAALCQWAQKVSSSFQEAFRGLQDQVLGGVFSLLHLDVLFKVK